MENVIERLVGKKIQKVYMNDEYLKFETDQGNVVYRVEGDCCSSSYFHDFTGLKKLFENGPVKSAQSIELGLPENAKQQEKDEVENGELDIYGYEIVTENPTFGDQTSVFSFRNSSNGYYGGWMENAPDETEVVPELKDDV